MSQTKVKSGLLNFPDQTDFVKLPSGTTAQRPSSPEKGYSRYNTTDNKLEFWDGTEWQQLPGITPPIITSISYPGDDLAADPAGGQTITITGTDFKSGATVTVDGTTPSVITFVSAAEITFTAPAKAAGDYDIVVTNVDGGNATAVDGMTYNGLPSWTTPAGNLGTFEENTTIPTITLVAAEPDSGAISYSITTGGLPTGLTLSGADIDGTTPTVTGETTYNFTVAATDNENQSTERSFNIIVYKFVPSFNTVTYTGNATPRSITGVGFQPDFVWIKARSMNAYAHRLTDSVRGATKLLYSSSTTSENIDVNALTSFDSDGFTIGNEQYVNGNGINFVAWCWKAGGAAVTNADGTITSQVSANTEAGFSIVSYTGTEENGQTIGHGLNTAPDFVIVKSRDISINWHVYHSAVMTGGDAKFLRLNTTDAILTDGNDNVWDSGFNNQTFGVGAANNKLNNKTIAYCFAEVAGFSKFGSYTGNGSTNGPTITTGFEPAFVMLKRTDSTADWFMFDNKRNPTNNRNKFLRANISDAEATGSATDYVSFNADNFKLTSDPPSLNGSGGTYIYMAFANQY